MLNKVEDFIQKIENVSSPQELAKVKSKIMGSKGWIKSLIAQMPHLPLEERKKQGSLINKVKIKLEEAIQMQSAKLIKKGNNLIQEDLSLPTQEHYGYIHPITDMLHRLCNIFQRMGFDVMESQEIEDEYHNFDVLNIPQNHPSRNITDTFYLQTGKLLRTHTTTGQNRMLKNIQNNQGVVIPGRVYRRDYYDSTHSPMFHQIDGIFLSNNITLGQLKKCLQDLIKSIFGDKEIRIRPSFFPFTEPSIEIDFLYKGKWIEVLGAGIINSKVLKNTQAKVQSGFAFGLGVERFAMLYHGIDDLRDLCDNDLKLLQYYGGSPFTT